MKMGRVIRPICSFFCGGTHKGSPPTAPAAAADDDDDDEEELAALGQGPVFDLLLSAPAPPVTPADPVSWS